MTTGSVQFPAIPGAAPPHGRYSHVAIVEAGRTAFVAGQLSLDATGAIVGDGDFEVQLRQVIANLQLVLGSLGASMADVAKFTTFLVDSHDITEFMRVRTELWAEIYPDGVYPANTLLVVDRLVEEPFLVEIEAIVRLPDAPRP